MNGCTFHLLLRQNLGWFCLKTRKHFVLEVSFYSQERAWIALNNGTRDFQNRPSFERSACFYVTTTGNFERFHYFIFETNFLKNGNLFSKNWSTVFYFKVLRLKAQCFHTKLPYQKPMLREIEWEVHNGLITNDGVFLITTLLFWEFCFRVKITSKELIWCTNYPNIHIHTFRKRWSFIWGCFFPVSILKEFILSEFTSNSSVTLL